MQPKNEKEASFIKGFLWPDLESVEDAEGHLATAAVIAGLYIFHLIFLIMGSAEFIGLRIMFVLLFVSLAYFSWNKKYWASAILAAIGILEAVYRFYLLIEYDISAVRATTFLIFVYSITISRSLFFLISQKRGPIYSNISFEGNNPSQKRTKNKSQNTNEMSFGKLPFYFLAVILILIFIGVFIDTKDAKKTSFEPKPVAYEFVKTKLTTYDEKLTDKMVSVTAVNDTGKIITQFLLEYKNGGCGNPANAVVASAQRKLKQNGYEPGPTDGIMGGRTVAALKRYQQKQAHLKVTGKLDDATLSALDINSNLGWKTTYVKNYLSPNGTINLNFHLPENPSNICFRVYASTVIK
jgi:hypothetical protein